MILETFEKLIQTKVTERNWECFAKALSIIENRIKYSINAVEEFHKYWTNLNVLHHHLRRRVRQDRCFWHDAVRFLGLSS